MYVARMYWSANGKYILINYAPRTVEDAGFHDTVYYIAKPDGSFSVLLTEDGNLRPVISPNEQFIAYPNTKDELFIIDLNQFSKEGITPFASINHDSRIMWDSNSEGIVFVYHSNLRPNQLAYYHANTGIRFLTNNHEIPTSEMAFLNR